MQFFGIGKKSVAGPSAAPPVKSTTTSAIKKAAETISAVKTEAPSTTEMKTPSKESAKASVADVSTKEMNPDELEAHFKESLEKIESKLEEITSSNTPQVKKEIFNLLKKLEKDIDDSVLKPDIKKEYHAGAEVLKERVEIQTDKSYLIMKERLQNLKELATDHPIQEVRGPIRVKIREVQLNLLKIAKKGDSLHDLGNQIKAIKDPKLEDAFYTVRSAIGTVSSQQKAKKKVSNIFDTLQKNAILQNVLPDRQTVLALSEEFVIDSKRPENHYLLNNMMQKMEKAISDSTLTTTEKRELSETLEEFRNAIAQETPPGFGTSIFDIDHIRKRAEELSLSNKVETLKKIEADLTSPKTRSQDKGALKASLEENLEEIKDGLTSMKKDLSLSNIPKNILADLKDKLYVVKRTISDIEEKTIQPHRKPIEDNLKEMVSRLDKKLDKGEFEKAESYIENINTVVKPQIDILKKDFPLAASELETKLKAEVKYLREKAGL